MSYAIGIDLGGTNIKAVAVTVSGEQLDQNSVQTHGQGGTEWSGRVLEQIQTIEKRLGERAACIGISSPGIVAPDGRSIGSVSGHLESIQGFDWMEFLPGARRVTLLNDAHAALLGEVWKGEAAGARDAILITLGTGGGGAALVNGQLLKGHLGRGGHLGHMCLDVDGQPDSLGIPGTFEEAIGNRTLKVRSGGLFTSTDQLVKAHLSGDPQASRVWLRSVYQLACALTSLINILDPEVVIIGGGVAAAGEPLFGPLSQYLSLMEWRPYGSGVRILPAALGSNAGALGAAHYALTSISSDN